MPDHSLFRLRILPWCIALAMSGSYSSVWAEDDIQFDSRFLELKGLNIETTEEEVRDNLISRDKIDSERAVAPLKKADDAILVDNSSMTKEQTINYMLSFISDI